MWDNYLNDRDAESSFWILPSAGHYPQRDNPEEVAKVIRLALTGQLPNLESEGAFMRTHTATRSADDAMFVGRSRVNTLNFPSSIEYTPEGYHPSN